MRQQPRRPIRDRSQAQTLECVVGALVGRLEQQATALELPAPWLACLRREADILARAHLWEQGGQLEGACNAALANTRYRPSGDIPAGKTNGATRWLQSAGDQIEQRRFTSTV